MLLPHPFRLRRTHLDRSGRLAEFFLLPATDPQLVRGDLREGCEGAVLRLGCRPTKPATTAEVLVEADLMASTVTALR